MNFVDEQDVVGLQIGQQRGQIARAFEHGAGGLFEVDAHFARDDVCERGFAQTRRAEQQGVIKCFLARARRADKNIKLFANFDLPDVFVQ